ncbi:hypothetical protein [Acuticoccus mangrovi]|uniref:Uncharacterized protein n=1 Tax=Acuticoccus mangrovi TaxID=2796142 RepID=A0A934INR1_9HYPH|nr:hypothetical protein [Acuticoccus mangrovi]MBJ3775567.1 hypothetical protein [Acuticoccus mangrovi]
MERDRLPVGSPMIFIVYNVGDHAVDAGYEPWLRETDNPFFNAIPGIRHYANWKMTAPGIFGWLDFMALDDHDSLESVWFNKDLDAFRTEWVRLWGYGEAPHPMIRYSYWTTCRRSRASLAADEGWLALGHGEAPDDIDVVWTVEGSLSKHFAGAPRAADWLLPKAERNPLGYDWVGFSLNEPAPVANGAVLHTTCTARP